MSDDDDIFELEPGRFSLLYNTDKFLLKSILREESKPFYRFEVFPNLKKLRIHQADWLFTLGSFVVDGFAALTKLQELKLNILRSAGCHYILQGLSKLPLLRKFTLRISFLKNEEWSLLEQFLRRQTRLETLKIGISLETCDWDRYHNQKRCLEEIVKGLENKPLLKVLELKSIFFSLEVLSKGFAHLKMKNQLQTFKIEASDETITNDTKTSQRVEGLCNFIKNQKESLRFLDICLPLALEANTVTEIAEAISQVKSLRTLHLELNNSTYTLERLSAFFDYSLQLKIAKRLRKKHKPLKKWNPGLAKHLKKLKSLETFRLGFEIHHKDSAKWFLDVMTALPNMKKLRNIHVFTSSEVDFLHEAQKLKAALLELKNIRELIMNFGGMWIKYKEALSDIKNTVVEVNERQLLRCDLMFL